MMILWESRSIYIDLKRQQSAMVNGKFYVVQTYERGKNGVLQRSLSTVPAIWVQPGGFPCSSTVDNIMGDDLLYWPPKSLKNNWNQLILMADLNPDPDSWDKLHCTIKRTHALTYEEVRVFFMQSLFYNLISIYLFVNCTYLCLHRPKKNCQQCWIILRPRILPKGIQQKKNGQKRRQLLS